MEFSQKLKNIIISTNNSWSKNLQRWNFDTYSKKFVPIYKKNKLFKYLKKNKIELMGTNERFKLNQIVFWAISYKCTKSLIYLNKIKNEIELFKLNSSFGRGVAYFTTLNLLKDL